MTAGHPDVTALDRFRTGELPEAEQASVADHVAGCEACAGALAELESFAAAVARAYAADRAVAAGEEPDWARVRERIAEGTAAGAGAPAPVGGAGREARARRPVWVRWGPQAAAAVVALLVLGVLWREGVQGPEDARRIAERQAPPVAAPEAPSPADRLAGTAPASEPGAREPGAPLAPGPPATEGDVARAETQAARDGVELEARARDREADFRRDAPGAAPEALADGVAQREERPADERAANERADDQDRANQAAKAAPAAARMAEAAALDPHDRFAVQAREALAASDTLSARRTLALWRDTLAPRDELDPALRDQADALADSLAAFLSGPRD